ncbi:MAG: hypothetical protein ABSA83_23805 [Verrucomicrobiota bacterium]|jgi:hypothetical protein
MGFLTPFQKAPKPDVKRLPTGTFTVDAECRIVSSTVPGWVPEAQVRSVGRQVLAIFEGARKANLQFSELVVQYAAFKITARQMRGGAIIFFSPRVMQSVPMP